MAERQKKKEHQFGMDMVDALFTDVMRPHESLRYVGRLFKVMAVMIFLLLLAEVGLGVAQDGIEALPLLLLEVAQLLVIAGLLWGGGDLTYLIVETNNDLRASRVLLWQMNQLLQMDLSSRGVEIMAVDPNRPIEEDENGP